LREFLDPVVNRFTRHILPNISRHISLWISLLLSPYAHKKKRITDFCCFTSYMLFASWVHCIARTSKFFHLKENIALTSSSISGCISSSTLIKTTTWPLDKIVRY
jgi:hypothetical protein